MRIVVRLFIVVFCASALAPAWAGPALEAKPSNYKDKNGYFTITLPPNWVIEDLSSNVRSKLICRSPDNAVMIMVLAESDNDELGDVYNYKADFVKDNKTLQPLARFKLSSGKFAGIDSVDLSSEYPNGIKQEAHYLFYSRVRFDLSYTASKAEYFDTYLAQARESLISIKLIGLPAETK